jgi:hypothetical protein
MADQPVFTLAIAGEVIAFLLRELASYPPEDDVK